MSESFFWGMAFGIWMMGLFWWGTHSMYRTTLLMCANQGTPEKIGNGFYYIVPESEWVDALVAKAKQEAAK